MENRVQILDTTLRDGEQTSGVSFAMQEKLSITRLLLEDVNVDRVEIASARVSDGELIAAGKVAGWAKSKNMIDRVEILGFVDGKSSVDWICGAGLKVMNLLCKGSSKHCLKQLRKSEDEHLADIESVINYAKSKGVKVNVYLEDWSDGMEQDRQYVFKFIDNLKNYSVERFMLSDTLGILNPDTTYEYCLEMITRYPDLRFDFHPHNDYGLAVANIYAAIKAGIRSVHTTVNGLGERAGNAPLSSVLPVIHDQLRLKTSINENQINRVSKLVETYSGIHIPKNEPVVGENVFTQVSGVHADGDEKDNLYCNGLKPERFGREREYALGKMSGKANIKMNLEALGIDLDEAQMKLVTDRIIELGDKKQIVSQDDLPYIVSDVLKGANTEQKVKVTNYSLSLAQGLKPVANVAIEIDGQAYQQSASGDGQYDAFMKALWKIYDGLGKPHPILTDYSVTIPPGGRTDSFVQTIITWNMNGTVFKTHGFDADQTEAAITATKKMLNIIETIK